MSKRRVAIFFSGRGSNMKALIEAANSPDYPAEIALALSNRADAPGFALAAGLPSVCIPSKDFGGDREALVERWAGKMLNIHPSLLPAYPGLHTHARVLAAGETRHGCTVHLVTKTMDDGPILAQAEVPVLPDDTEQTLADRVLVQEHRIYPAALAAYIAQMPLPAATSAP